MPRMPRRKEPQVGLSRAIRKRRVEMGISQREMARRAEIDPSSASRLESGTINPEWGTIEQIASALDTSMTELAALAEEMDRRLDPNGRWIVKSDEVHHFDIDAMRVDDVD